MFRVFSVKKFPGLSDSTALSKVLVEQGVRMRIRIEVREQTTIRLATAQLFEEPLWDEPIYGEPGFEDDGGASSWNDSGDGSRKGSMPSTATFRDRLMSLVVDKYSLPTSNISLYKHNFVDVKREKTLLLLTEEELRRNSISEPNAHKSGTTSTWIHSQCNSLMTRDEKSRKDEYDRCVEGVFHCISEPR